jgi:hypothetical protein
MSARKTKPPRQADADPGEQMSAFLKACRAFGVWRRCEKECRRRQGCAAADPRACFMRFWERVDGESRARVQVMIKARLDGESLEACNRIGDEAVARWRALKEGAETGGKSAGEADRRTPQEPRNAVRPWNRKNSSLHPSVR